MEKKMKRTSGISPVNTFSGLFYGVRQADIRMMKGDRQGRIGTDHIFLFAWCLPLQDIHQDLGGPVRLIRSDERFWANGFQAEGGG